MENPAQAFWAVYPYDPANTCDGTSVTLTVPATQASREGSFANKLFPAIATSPQFQLAFYNVCGGIRFTVAHEGINALTILANNGEPLAGKVRVSFGSGGVPVVDEVVEGVSAITVNAPEGGFIPGAYYFAALLPQTLAQGLTLTFAKSEEAQASVSLDHAITVNRSRFGILDEKDKDLTFPGDGGITPPDPSDLITFADDKVKAKLVAAFDTNGDGELSYAEAAAATSIQGVFSAVKTYKSFDEFQYFTGVTTIPDNMFLNWNLLESIMFPPGLTEIGRRHRHARERDPYRQQCFPRLHESPDGRHRRRNGQFCFRRLHEAFRSHHPGIHPYRGLFQRFDRVDDRYDRPRCGEDFGLGFQRMHRTDRHRHSR